MTSQEISESHCRHICKIFGYKQTGIASIVNSNDFVTINKDLIQQKGG